MALAGCATARTPNDSLDSAARDYVRLQIAIGQKEEGYIDAFYGPKELEAAGKALAAAEGLPALRQRVDALSRRVGRLAGPDNRRARFLRAQLGAAETRLRMLQGEKLSFNDEARGLFGVVPDLQPLSTYDPVLASIERLVPGNGPLADRVDTYQNRFKIAPERLRPVFEAAITECKARTLRHIALPAGEQFGLAFVTGKSWSGYNYYQGGYRSKIEINTDLPIRISRAVDLGCHEGYPGHHALGVLIEQKLTRQGQVEHSVFPLYSPQAIIAEGSANYGIELAFPGEQKSAYEAAALYPLAGLPGSEARRYDALLNAMKTLAGARMTIARDYLDGRISEEQAVQLTRKYQLVSEARAKQSDAFTKQYRSYVINYGLGLDLVRADVERRPAGASRWKRFEQIISEPTLPSDLQAR
jgi:hypothetical protein